MKEEQALTVGAVPVDVIEIPQRMRLKQLVIVGAIMDTRYNKSAKELEHLLRYDGEEHVERWFLASQLEEAPAS
jgi:hypothetical protein